MREVLGIASEGISEDDFAKAANTFRINRLAFVFIIVLNDGDLK